MKAYKKTIIYVLDDLNQIDKEINRQFQNGWRVYKKGEVTQSYLYPSKKEIEIIYLLRKI